MSNRMDEIRTLSAQMEGATGPYLRFLTSRRDALIKDEVKDRMKSGGPFDWRSKGYKSLGGDVVQPKTNRTIHMVGGEMEPLY